MKTGMTPSGKNLCDKCGGSYATLAALISHKKSCKKNKTSSNISIDGSMNNIDLNKSNNDSDETDNDLFHSIGHLTHLRHQSPNDEQQHNWSKLMAMENAAAAAAAAMENSSTSTNPLSSLAAQWPGSMSAAFAATGMPDMSALLESLTPLFAASQQTSSSSIQERNEPPSPSPDEQQQQQAALFTQQMMLFHMFQQMQQLQGAQIPSFPLLAAAAAAAAHQQQQSSQMIAPATSPSLSSTRSIEHQLADNSVVGHDKKTSIDSMTNKHISRSSNFSLSKRDGDMDKPKSLSSKDDKDEPDDGKRPAPSSTPTSDRSGPTASSMNNSNSARKLLSTILDLKDTNPDAPLPPMMSPPKTDSSESVPFNEPNTLELLQKHTEQALQNTMSGGSFLLNGLSASDNNELLNFRKGKDGKEDPASRHRCKFCGKVFGSDSALQIHIRSHTGERPFKCNVCGNRFTTKGNLKVHFQRHKAKYPHVKMNPHPVPEHLDKFHPPLEPPSNSQSPPPQAPSSSGSLFSPSYATQSNALHIPAIFSSTLIPYATDDTANTSKSDQTKTVLTSSDKNKSKPKSLFDFAEFYKNGNDSRIDSAGDDDSYKSDHSDISSQSDNEDGEPASKHKQDQNQEPKESSQSNQKSPTPPSMTLSTVNQQTYDGSDTDLDSDDNQDQNDRQEIKDEQTINKTKKNKEPVDKDNDDDGKLEDNDLEDESLKMEDDSVEGSNQPLTDDIGNEDDDVDNVDDDDDDDDLYDDIELPYGSLNAATNSFGLMGLPFNVDHSALSNSVSLPASLAAVNNNSGAMSSGRMSESVSESDLAEAASKDPILYQNLLPKPGSTDNTWETLMEVQKASETVKLQQLVDNIEHKLNDPNQCIICQRVLSCKSALQMHYRTHTGERPFKCKICGRAFTTKGNLKTHMGVHRVKPPLRMLHQCPICHKQFTNALVLQQHIRLHSLDPNGATPPTTDITPEMLNDLKNNPLNFPRAFLPVGFNGPFPPLPPTSGPGGLFPPSFLTEMAAKHLNPNPSSSPLNLFNPANFPPARVPPTTNETDREENPKEKEEDNSTINDLSSPKEKTKQTEVTEEKSKLIAEDAHSTSDTTEIEDEPIVSPTKKKKIEVEKTNKKKEENTLSALEHHVLKSTSAITPQTKYLPDNKTTPENKNTNVLDLTPKSGSSSNNSSKLNNNNGQTETKTNFPSTPFAGLPYHPTGRPNTTCRICLKTFACFSALEIHYRSHTKERPFKCEVCDRGFSTKGNMKQHMLTHKIRDLPPDLYTTISPASNTTLGNFLTSNSLTKIIGKQIPQLQNSTNHHTSSSNNATSSNNSNASSRVSSPHTPNGNSMDSDKFRNTESPATESSNNTSTPRSSSSSSNKHMCRICNKPFSSGSALQIHMRTHTGDKPFKCTICGRAFTTKGNLKVHMGTHIYNNNPSRRGRRMSIDLPSLQITSPNSIHQQPTPASSSTSPSTTTTNTTTSVPSSSSVHVPSGQPPNEMTTHSQTTPETDLFLRYLTPHFLNSANPEASQLALQQMMLMKMMSNQEHQPLELATAKSANNRNNGDDDGFGNVDQSDADSESKEGILCEPEIDLNNPTTNNNGQKTSGFGSTTNQMEDDDEMENRSFRSDRSHQASDDWSTGKPLKCTLCSCVCNSPTEFEEHIKAHLHAAAAATNSMSTTMKSTADVAS